MSPLRLLLPFLMMVGGLLSSTATFAWQSTPARETVELGDNDELTADDDEFVFQDKTPAKPKEPPKPPARPQTPPATPSRPATPPAPVPAQPQPQQPQPQFNPFVNPQPNQPYLARLSRAPDMFGDSFGSFTGLTIDDTSPGNTRSEIRLPKPGGPRVFKNEQSRAMPTDRVFGLYHHFQNAFRLETASANVDLFTLGFEKTFLEGNTSIELRMPLSNPVGLSTGINGQSFQTHSAGDLIVTFKALLYSDESQAVALGLAVNTPTGSDLTVNVNDVQNFTLKNDATHLIPFVAYQATPNDDFFFNGFLQFDTPTNANSAQTSDGASGSVTDQTLMYADASFGYWLFRDDEAELLQGLAGVLELHYTTSLTRADNVDLGIVHFGANSGRVDVINLTVGLQANVARSTSIRAAFVTPLRDGKNRFFDSEISLAVVFRL